MFHGKGIDVIGLWSVTTALGTPTEWWQSTICVTWQLLHSRPS